MLARVARILVCAVALLGAFALGGCSLLPPLPGDRSAGQSAVSNIAYIGSDDHVYVAAPDGSATRRVTEQVKGLSATDGWTYRWPTYSPDGKRLAFAGYRSRSGALLGSAILGADTEQAQASVLLESSQLSPIYLYWSPDSRHVAALVQGTRTLELHLLDAAGSEAPRLLVTGQPLYWSWAPDGRTVAVHIGGAASDSSDAWVGLLHLEDGATREERFSEAPGGFRAPAWSPGGDKLAFVSLSGGTSLLSVRDSVGRITRVASSPTDVAFNWSPGGEWLAFASASAMSAVVYEGVELVHPDGTERHRLSQDPQVGFYWAPDSKRLALLGLDMAARQLAWSTVQTDGKGKRQLAAFAPSNDFAFQLPFFDQYAQSTNVWSPDGRKLVYASTGGVERSNGSTDDERVMVLEVDGEALPTAVAAGGAAVWSPPRAR